MNEDNLTTEIHPNWYHEFTPMYRLILGSFPPHESKRNFPFYYPNRQNRFWKILAELAQIPIDTKLTPAHDAVVLRKAMMEKLHVGIQNLGYKICRKGKSSLDTHIEITEYHDILGILSKHPELNIILLSGYSAAHSTVRAFERYLHLQKIPISYPNNFQYKPYSHFNFTYKGKVYQCVIVNSTSPASAIPYETILKQFETFLLPNGNNCI